MAYDDPYRRSERESAPFDRGGTPARPAREDRGVATGSPSEGLADRSPGSGTGRDRLSIHLLWEALLLVGTGGLVYLLWRAEPAALRGDQLAELLVSATGFVLLGMAASVSLRAAAPNLAIGPVAAAAGVMLADRGGDGVLAPTVFALGLAVLLGVAVALLVAAFHVPGWAATLAAAAVVVVWLQLQPAEVTLSGGHDPSGHGPLLFVLAALVSVLGGLLGAVRSVRARLGAFRPSGDPARRRGGPAAVSTGAALVLSMVLAVPAGLLLVAGAGVPAQGSVGVNWLLWTMIGLAVALVGGVSAYGRRGGVFGTLVAVVALVIFHRYQQEQGWQIALLATAAFAVGIGLVVTRLVERFGRSGRHTDSEPEPEPWSIAGAQALPSQRREERRTEPIAGGGATDAWSEALPARPAHPGPATPPWDDDSWPGR